MKADAMRQEIISANSVWIVEYGYNFLFLVPCYNPKKTLSIIDKSKLLRITIDNIPNEKISTIAMELSELIKTENKEKVVYFALKKYNDIGHKKIQNFLDHLGIHHLTKFLLIETE